MKKIENSLKCDECEKVFMTKMDFESHVSLQEKLNTTQILFGYMDFEFRQKDNKPIFKCWSRH